MASCSECFTSGPRKSLSLHESGPLFLSWELVKARVCTCINRDKKVLAPSSAIVDYTNVSKAFPLLPESVARGWCKLCITY